MFEKIAEHNPSTLICNPGSPKFFLYTHQPEMTKNKPVNANIAIIIKTNVASNTVSMIGRSSPIISPLFVPLQAPYTGLQAPFSLHPALASGPGL